MNTDVRTDAMASSSMYFNDSSDEESLAVLKRKTKDSENRFSKEIDSENSSFQPTVEVKVENFHETTSICNNYRYAMSAPNFSQSSFPSLPSNSVPKKKIRKLYPCGCGIVFTNEENLQQHDLEMHNNPGFDCRKCGQIFKTDQELMVHMHFHLDDSEIHACQICHRRFQQKHILARHMSIHAKEIHQCAKCPANFEDKSYLHDHYKLHHLEPRACPSCGLQLNTVTDLYRHVNSFHKDIVTTLCMHCGLILTTTKDRDQHIDQDHNNLAGCSVCFQKYNCKCTVQNQFDGSSANLNNPVTVASNEENLITPEDLKPDEDVKPAADEYTSELDPLDEPGEQLFVECLYDVPVKMEDLSLATKCAIVTKMHKGKSVAEMCKFYHLTPEIVNELWEDRDNIVIPKKIGMKSSKYMNSVLDAKILEWFHSQRELGVQITGKMLINVAEEYAKECGFVVFNGNVKWLDRFKTRHKISLRPNWARKQKKMGVPNDAIWKNQFLNEIWPEVSKDFDFEDIYTADEIGIFYNPSKGRIRKHTGRKYIHGFSKDRFSILLCTNMTGQDRKRLLVCGTDDPLCNSHRDPNTLPVTYIRHSNAHFTTEMFEEYVNTWNSQLQKEDKKVLLILDRASIHSKLPLTHLKLVFVPWKASTGLMPIKQGIYNKFREEYRKLILQEKCFNVMRGIDRHFTCLEGLEMIYKAWHRVPCSAIIDGFRVIGYKVPDSPVMDLTTPRANDAEDKKLCRMLQEYDFDDYFVDLGNIDMYLMVEDEHLTAQGTNGSVFGGNHKVPEHNAFQELETGELLPIAANKTEKIEREKLILKARALEDLDIIRKHIESNKSSYETFKAFMDVEKFLLRNPPKNKH